MMELFVKCPTCGGEGKVEFEGEYGGRHLLTPCPADCTHGFVPAEPVVLFQSEDFTIHSGKMVKFLTLCPNCGHNASMHEYLGGKGFVCTALNPGFAFCTCKVPRVEIEEVKE